MQDSRPGGSGLLKLGARDVAPQPADSHRVVNAPASVDKANRDRARAAAEKLEHDGAG